MKILGIESSCDETACAVVEDGVKELASVVASSQEMHEKTGGVVPEVAARKQVESIIPVIEETLNKLEAAGNYKTKDDVIKDISSIAVTVGPGLIGSLIVGVEAAKALSVAWGKPLIPVNHLVGHIYANFLYDSVAGEKAKNIRFPAVSLLVSGGHTDLVLIKGHGDLEYLGGTLDDAAGEAFDKTARLLGFSQYLGGVLLSKEAAKCTNNTLAGKLPRPLMDEPNFDFSFSGLKTAVRNLVQSQTHPPEIIACEFEQAIVDVLVHKTVKAAKKYGVENVLMGGGVSANTLLRSRLLCELQEIGVDLFVPSLRLCGDNAVYIASAAYFINKPRDIKDINANPSLGIMDKA